MSINQFLIDALLWGDALVNWRWHNCGFPRTLSSHHQTTTTLFLTMQFSAERKIFLSDLANIIFSKSITLLSCVSQWIQNIISPWCTWTIVEWHLYLINPNRSWPENLIDLLGRVWICGHWSSGPLLTQKFWAWSHLLSGFENGGTGRLVLD